MPGIASGLGSKALPEGEAALLVSYMLARWGAEPVAWVINSGSNASETGAVQKICGSVFTNSVHAPVILCAGPSPELADGLRGQTWIDALGVEVPANPTFQEANPGGDLHGQDGVPRPVVLFVPCENGMSRSARKRFNAEDVRHAVYQGLLLWPPAGVTYAAHGVTSWDSGTDLNPIAGIGAGMPLWERALFMPGAKQMRAVANLMNSIDFWRLQPRPDAVPSQAGQSTDEPHVVAASTSAKDLTFVYLPRSNPVDVSLQAMPASPVISWLEPRQGSTRSAVAVVSGSVCQFPPPGEGDWVLLIKSGK